MGPGALPSFVIAGFMKCGTTSLHRYLDLHPEIAMSQIKEPDFFFERRGGAGNWHRGLDWYRAQFDPRAPVRGEASVNYTALPLSEGAAERMAEVVPRAKLVFCLRDPVERAVSHYLHAAAAGRESRSAAEALADPEERYVRRSRYWMQLEPFALRFERERMLFLTADELHERRREELRRTFAFLGVAEDFDSPGFDREWEVTAGKDAKFRLAYRLSRRLGDKTFWGWVPGPLRSAAERLAYAPLAGSPEPPRLDEGLRDRLRGWLGEDAAELRRYTGMELSGWCV